MVFDIDGVLSDAAGRQHFLERGRRDWTAFFEACGDDPVIEEIARLLELLDSSLAVILLTGRPQRVQPQTLAWLARYGLRWDLLVMRSRGDYAQVTEFKQSVVDDLRGPRVRPAAGLRGRPLQPCHVRRRRHPVRLHPLRVLRVAAGRLTAAVRAIGTPAGAPDRRQCDQCEDEHGQVAPVVVGREAATQRHRRRQYLPAAE